MTIGFKQPRTVDTALTCAPRFIVVRTSYDRFALARLHLVDQLGNGPVVYLYNVQGNDTFATEGAALDAARKECAL